MIHTGVRNRCCHRLALIGSLLLAFASSDALAQRDRRTEQETRSRLEIYGYVMADAIHDFKTMDPDWFDVLRPSKLPSFEDEFGDNNHTWLSVRQTRFGTKAYFPTGLGELFTLFEWDLFGVGVNVGETTFHLRHAYAELGKFGAGQYWTPFMDIDVFPTSLEYWGPNGAVNFRNVQLRYMPIQGRSRVTVALERPGATADQGRFEDRIELDNVLAHFPLPNLTAEARLGRDWGYIEVAGLLADLQWDDLLPDDEFDLEGGDLGWGLNFSSNLYATDETTIKLQFVFGEGIENYLSDAPADVGISLRFDDPRRPIEGEALGVVGLVAFVDHEWSSKFSTAIGYSFVDIGNTSGQAPNSFGSGHYALVNLLYYPTTNIMVGGEAQFGRRENAFDDFDANDFRLQFSARFNYLFKFWNEVERNDK